jgi:hypothetical protein
VRSGQMEQRAGDPPGMITGAATTRTRGVAALACLVVTGCLVAAILGSRPLVEWAEANPGLPAWVGDGLRSWDATLTRVGLAEMHPLVRSVVDRVRGQ